MKTFQKSLLIFLCFFVFYTRADAQSAGKYYPKYDLQADKQWIDSLKSIIRKGPPPYPDNEHMAPYWKKEFRFLASCEALGLYYERLYDKRKVKDMSKALFYYNKIVELDKFPDNDTIVYRASALRTTLYRKLEDIYFKGKGVKKDREKSFEYALSGMTDQAMFKLYSERYYHCNCPLLSSTANFNYVTGLNFPFEVNPFAYPTAVFMKAPMKAEIRKITDAFLKRYAAENLVLVITTNSGNSARGQAISYHLLDYIKHLTLHYTTIPEKVIFTNNIVGEDGPTLEISFMTLKQWESKQ
jgi:hypothetical protein